MKKLNDKQRYEKLEQAQKLIREVEFSYANGDENRTLLYQFVVNSFSLIGSLNGYLVGLKERAETYKQTEEESEREFLESLGIK